MVHEDMVLNNGRSLEYRGSIQTGIMTRKIKIIHILSNPNIGGIERMLSDLLPRVNREPFEMAIINLRSESEAYALWDRVNIKYHRIKTPCRLLLDSIPSLTILLRREMPDIVEIYGLRANIIGRVAARLAGVPIVLTGVLSTDDWRRRWHVLLDRATRWAVTAWIPNSQACMQSIIVREGHPKNKMKVIYDGIDVEYWKKDVNTTDRSRLRSEWGCQKDDIVFATVANLRPDKGIQYLIEAIPIVLEQERRLHFIIVGRDLMRGVVQQRCKDLGIENIVTFTGFREDIREIYQACDVTVLPSLREGLPICLIEAMAMELPVVATSVSGIPELVVDGETGIIVPPKDVKALSNAMLKIVRDAKKMRNMGLAGRNRVFQMFTIERMLQELMGYYQQLFGSLNR